MASEKKTKTYSARVDDRVIRVIHLMVKVKGMSERGVVKRGLELALEDAAKNEPQLVQQYNARLQAEIDNVGTLAAPSTSPSPAELLRAESALREVPNGGNGVTCEVDMETHRMLEIVGRWTGRNGSELIRHGLFLAFDEARQKEPDFEKKLTDDFDADRRLLREVASDPSLGNAATAHIPRKPPVEPTSVQPAAVQPDSVESAVKVSTATAPAAPKTKRAPTATKV